MLVLSRQRDESILIGDGIELTVVDIRGDKVRLGSDAPVHVTVHRKEVYEAIRGENEQAALLPQLELTFKNIERVVLHATTPCAAAGLARRA
jgi:carbon storage regulator